MGSGTSPVQTLQAGAQNDQICSTPLKIIERPPTAQNGGSGAKRTSRLSQCVMPLQAGGCGTVLAVRPHRPGW
jgi:hypothetical protein